MATNKQAAKGLTSFLAILILSSPILAAEPKEKPKSPASALVDKIGELGSNAAAGVYYFSGLSLIRSGKYKQALSEINKAIEFSPTSGIFFRSRGECYILMDQYSKCIDDVTQAIKLGDDRAECYSIRGRAYYELKDYAKSNADLTEAIRKDPNDATAHLLHAMCSLALYDTEKASRSMERAFELDPLLEAKYAKSLKEAIAIVRGYNEPAKASQATVAEASNDEKEKRGKVKPTEKARVKSSNNPAIQTKVSSASAGAAVKSPSIANTKPSFSVPEVLVYPGIADASTQAQVEKDSTKPVPAHTVETFSGGAVSIKQFDRYGNPITQE